MALELSEIDALTKLAKYIRDKKDEYSTNIIQRLPKEIQNINIVLGSLKNAYGDQIIGFKIELYENEFNRIPGFLAVYPLEISEIFELISNDINIRQRIYNIFFEEKEVIK